MNSAHHPQTKPAIDSAEGHNAHGRALRTQGRLPEAIESFRRAIVLRPGAADQYNNLGDALQSAGRLDDAIAAYRKAIALHPACVEASYNLGTALQESGRLEEAIEIYRRTLRLAPALPEAHLMLGNALGGLGRVDEAARAYENALRARPDYAEAYHNLGLALFAGRRFEQAAAATLRAIELRPNFAEAIHSLGCTYDRMGKTSAATEMYRRALSLRPDFPEAYNSLGWSYYQSGKLSEAMAAFNIALVQRPDYAGARLSRAFLLLSQGDLEHGLVEYEARWEAGKRSINRDFSQPLWDGSDLHGRRILLHSEQGLGDVIQFVRYVPMVRARGGRVILRCWRPLKRLLDNQPQLGIEQVITEKDSTCPFDTHCPIGSLPRLFGTRLHTIPADIPYLVTDEAAVISWRRRIAVDARGLEVGLVWAGDPNHTNDHLRSTVLATFAPLAAVQGVRLYSLQSGPGVEQAANPPPGMTIRTFSEGVGDMASTAALMQNLDLIVAVDTSAGHLAGAIGKAVWLLLHLVPDWRWMLDRSDTPWYPTMRLFRQTRLQDWSAPIAEMQRALAGLVRDVVNL